MNIYLIVSEDKSNAFVFSNVTKAKEKEKEIGNAYIFVWFEFWGRPLEFGICEVEDDKFNDTKFPWEMLIKAYEDEHWYMRAKYKKEMFDHMIVEKEKKELQRELDKRISKLKDIEYYEKMAKELAEKDPELAEMASRLKTLTV